MLRVGAEGDVEAIAFSRPAPGRFESVELGVADYATLSFTDAAEFPISMSVADFNGDGLTDLAVHVARQSYLRFFYGNMDGTFEEGLRLEMGREPHSMAAGDFDGDGRTDLAVSQIGTGSLVLFYREPSGTYRFRTFWIDSFRDYITVARTDSGELSVLGMNFADRAAVLVDFLGETPVEGSAAIDFKPSFRTDVTSAKGQTSRLSAVFLPGNLSVNLDNRLGQPVNVINVADADGGFVIVGDVDTTGSIAVGIARPRH
jgi:hypothetical protein